MLFALRLLCCKMGPKNAKKSTLSKKLNQRVKEIKNESRNEKPKLPTTGQVPDIEDIITGDSATKSLHFSPLQTRRQRAVIAQKASNLQISTASVLGTDEHVQEEKKAEEPHEEIKEAKVFKRPKNKDEAKIEIKVEECSPNKIEKKEEEEGDWKPANWETILANIRQMRLNVPAPVDTMGCESCADTQTDEKTQRFHKLVALMLSSQTKDEVTFEAVNRLKEAGLTPSSIVAMPTKRLEELLHPVGFYKNKAKYLQQTSSILVEKYNSDIPNNVKDLIALPGVGPKMAHICMATAWKEITGIGVDVHVHRISNRLNWVPKETKEPEQTRVALEAWLPRHLWSEVNHLFVGFGQTICTPVKPNCANCLNSTICPAAFKATPKKKSATRTPEPKDDVGPSAGKKSKETKKPTLKKL